ncbi:MAG: hypothetical protein WAU82_15510 [Candidatus Binatus sp.]|uniref:hypothetical protein n=1 Tax=Candidatus Binatus sp. TaxID=2811406 RepID=UPI003BAE8FD5
MRKFICLQWFAARGRRPYSRLIAGVAAIAMLTTTAAPVWAGGVFAPNNLVVSRSVYAGSASTITVGETLPPGCAAITTPLLSSGTISSGSANLTLTAAFGGYPGGVPAGTAIEVIGAGTSKTPDLTTTVSSGSGTAYVLAKKAGTAVANAEVLVGLTLPVLGGGTTSVIIPTGPSGCNVNGVFGGTGALFDGTYPQVFNNDGAADGSFAVSAPIFLDQLSTGGTLLNSLAIDPAMIDTSFSSKSELAVNKSVDGQSLTFMGYVGGPGFTTGANQLDVSNGNTPGLIDPTNPDVTQYYRAVAEVDASGNLTVTEGNAYSGDNGRAAIKGGNSLYYMTGNDNNGNLSKGQLSTTQVGVDLVNSTGAELLVPGNAPGDVPLLPPFIDMLGMLEFGTDKPGKDTNFRGLTIFDNTLYITKGSGSNGVNTVYQVGTPGTLPSAATTAGGNLGLPINILPGFPNTNASTTTDFPFGIFFANANTLYVADEGNGNIGTFDSTNAYDDALTQNGNPGGLEKWVFNGTSWNLAYTLTNGLGLGQPYTVASYPTGVNSATGNTNFPAGLPWAPAPDGLRNITGRVNTDGTVNIWAITSTISGNGDQGADPNQLVFVTDQLADTSNTPPPTAQFAVLETGGFGEVLRGVAFAPGAIASAPSSGQACNGVYNGTFQGNLKVSAGQNCVFVGGAITGNVQLDGGNLSLTNTSVNGNVQLQSGGSFSIGPSVTIDGNLQAHNLPAGGAGNQVCDSHITGNLQYQNSGTPVEIGSGSPTCTGNTIGGNVQFHNNNAQGLISNNTINGNLQCQNDTPPASGIAGSNTVGGQKQGECDDL